MNKNSGNEDTNAGAISPGQTEQTPATVPESEESEPDNPSGAEFDFDPNSRGLRQTDMAVAAFEGQRALKRHTIEGDDVTDGALTAEKRNLSPPPESGFGEDDDDRGGPNTIRSR